MCLLRYHGDNEFYVFCQDSNFGKFCNALAHMLITPFYSFQAIENHGLDITEEYISYAKNEESSNSLVNQSMELNERKEVEKNLYLKILPYQSCLI